MADRSPDRGHAGGGGIGRRDPIETAEPDDDIVTCDGGEVGCEERELDAHAAGWAWWRGQFLCPPCLTVLGARNSARSVGLRTV